MIKISDYVKLGFRGIVFLHVNEWSYSNGHRCDYTVQTLACFDKNGTPLVLEVHWVEKNLPRGNQLTCNIKKPELISQDDYERLVKRYGVQDDPMFYQSIARRDNARREAEREISELTPKCPICSHQMTFNYSQKNGNSYWECKAYGKSKCGGTAPISIEISRRYQHLLQTINQI